MEHFINNFPSLMPNCKKIIMNFHDHEKLDQTV